VTGGTTGGAGPTYVLITQCLQNDFLLNLNCRLRLPADAAAKLLLRNDSEHTFEDRGSRRDIDDEALVDGPLGHLLRLTVGERLRGGGRGTLHLVNVRDWHLPSETYDEERRRYGAHCEAGTWGADYPSALMHVLDPAGTRWQNEDDGDYAAAGLRLGSVVIHHVHSNTLFDMAPDASGRTSQLHDVLTGILAEAGGHEPRIAVVGLYTDIKVQLVLQSLRVAHNPRQLIVSDSLTASPTLERHLAALDFAHKVLRVEVMHGIGNLARFLGSNPEEDEELESSANEVVFADYAQYFQDKQAILSYEDAQLRGYRQQITGRLRGTARLVTVASWFLIGCGLLTLGSSVVLAVLAAAVPRRVPVVVPALVLGLSVVQLVSVFFTRPIQAATDMLSREAVFRMLLESRSLRVALARHHLTSPAALRADDAAERRAHVVQTHLDLLVHLDRVDFDRFEHLGEPRPDLAGAEADAPALEEPGHRDG
jgi:nicotinamidase-related amidase